MAEPPLVQLLQGVVDEQNLAAENYKRAMTFNRLALQHSREAETRLKRILDQFGIELEIRHG